MQELKGSIYYSASDLVNFLECEHRTALDVQALKSSPPPEDENELAKMIRVRGRDVEQNFIRLAQRQGLRVVDLSNASGEIEEQTALALKAMEAGADLIYQATLSSGKMTGRADFLQKVKSTSRFGSYGYEVLDAKPAREPRAAFMIQLLFYSDLLSTLQGSEPHRIQFLLGDGSTRTYLTADYSRYFRFVRERFLDRAADRGAKSAPEPCDLCPECRFRKVCNLEWEKEDRLYQVAGILKSQVRKLEAAGIGTMAALASLDRGRTIPRLAPETLERLKGQACLQAAKRDTGKDRYELLPPDPEGRRGFFRLPPPDKGDIFFDIEGDPLEPGGLEYLLGAYFFEEEVPRFFPIWAHNREEEKRAFETFIDFVQARLARFPGLHIYHYAPYEETALKKLMSLHGTREAEVDNLLRNRKLIDLYRVVREGLRVSEDSYSIKNLEIFFGKKREGAVQTAGESLAGYERWRMSRDPVLLDQIADYNKKDCLSLEQLRGWLLSLRPESIPWFSAESGEEEEEGEARESGEAEFRLSRFREALLAGLPGNRSLWKPAHISKEMVACLLDFHRREEKPFWWSLFAKREMTREERIDDPECLGGLLSDPDAPPYREKRSLVYTYRYPEQEFKLSEGDSCLQAETLEPAGSLLEIDEEKRIVRLKCGPGREPLPPELSLVSAKRISYEPLREAIYRVAESLIAGDGKYRAMTDFLERALPRFKGRPPGEPVISPGAPLLEAAIEAAANLKESFLFIQGPPGAGKTFTGSHLVTGLLQRGFKVGISSNSHHAINNFLQAIEKRAWEVGFSFKGVKKSNRDDPDTWISGECIGDSFDSREILSLKPDLVAGTAWLFSRPEFDGTLDYLFIDEAGQVSLANLLAAGTSARNLILLGDQMQLGQPVMGIHPLQSGESSLEYLLQGDATISPERGIFLDTTWRMRKEICRFISEAIYDGRLRPEAGTANQRIIM
ncbi:MAG TPA: TM0106 family RecB-like putative nuclease, partial [Nitrospiria bacterium]|nr:TM0106 family RecB-like putative nuclease [Nitrospiria bacterium]